MTHIKQKECPFCEQSEALPDDRVLARNALSFCILDAFPVSKGHALVIPVRHVQSFFEISKVERTSMFEMLDVAKITIDQKFGPDGYNIGINDGTAAGQTIPHLHIHLIPRYPGDLDKPEGGIRWIFPNKAVYWD